MNGSLHNKLIKYLLLFFSLEGILTVLWIVLTPADQKNAIFLGFSLNRWILILFVLVVATFTTIASFKVEKVTQFFSKLINNKSQNSIIQLITSISLVLFWMSIWISPSFLPDYQFEIERLKPVLVLVTGLLAEGLLFFHFTMEGTTPGDYWKKVKNNRKYLFAVGGVFLVTALIYTLMRFLGPHTDEKALSFPPGPPISPFQVLSGMLLFLIVFFMSGNNSNSLFSHKLWGVVIPILVFAGAFFLWTTTPFVCADDRPGPYLPNGVCYPQVDDSVYSIGAHYITLGRGVFNHWFTDKPFYMLFLAIGQFIAGSQIDHYLIFQIGVLALIPVLLYFLGKKLSGFASGVLLAFLSIIQGINSIRYYATAGGVNVKLENSEILTSLLLITFCLLLVRFFTRQSEIKWILLAGGILGLACLTRMNPIFILPLIIGYLLVIFWKKWKMWLTSVLVLFVGFSVVFMPWLFFANDGQGNNYYLQKIESVLFYRYKKQTNDTQNWIFTASKQENSQIPVVSKLAVPPNKNAEFDGITSVDPVVEGVDEEKLNLSSIIEHFLNNEYMAVARLPVNFQITPMEEVLNQSIWLDSHRLPFWKLSLSLENFFSFSLNFLFILTGLTFAFHRWGLTGLVPLMIQLGYHLANGFALTSGERYLEPVEWVSILYFSLGIFWMTIAFFPGVHQGSRQVLLPGQMIIPKASGFFNNKNNLRAILILVFLGALLPATYLLKDVLPQTIKADLVKVAQKALVEEDLSTRKAVNEFVKDPKSVVVEGYAYHPRLYYSPLVLRGNQVFELTVLTREKVYISNYLNFKDEGSFRDGSKVILLGCVIKEKNFWGAKSVLIRTIGIIDVDNDKVYKNKWSKLDCQ